jgi:hypothetical protein
MFTYCVICRFLYSLDEIPFPSSCQGLVGLVDTLEDVPLTEVSIQTTGHNFQYRYSPSLIYGPCFKFGPVPGTYCYARSEGCQ